ncbi:MAG: hypothetical protein ACXVDF_24145, partial [Ktedonobacterales bacterium]
MFNARTLRSIGLLALFGLSVLLSACDPTPRTTIHVNKRAPVIEAIQQEPDSLLPYTAGVTFSNLVMNAIWAPLWYSDNRIPFQYHPGLAKEVPALSNGGIRYAISAYPALGAVGLGIVAVNLLVRASSQPSPRKGLRLLAVSGVFYG